MNLQDTINSPIKDLFELTAFMNIILPSIKDSFEFTAFMKPNGMTAFIPLQVNLQP